MTSPSLHPKEEGPHFVLGKPYYWDKGEDGVRRLRPWPNDPDGIPIPYEYLPRGDQ